MCRDFKMGQCQRPQCKYLHVVEGRYQFTSMLFGFRFLASPEPLSSRGELIVYPYMLWRPSASTIFKDLL